jgi:predicted anti-sigma-YlaC factor YlaD
MSEDLHKHARQLLAAARVEGISDAEQAWLEAHMQECAQCGQYASSLERTIGDVRSLAAPLDPALVRVTQFRVRLRAQELREQKSRMRGLWISCVLSWVLGALSAPLLWWGFRWVGRHMVLPDLAWQTAFVLWWVMPAAAAAAVLAGLRTRDSSENGFLGSPRR